MAKPRHCAYCGKLAEDTTNDHVVPRGLYPISARQQRVSLITVPSCRSCNSSWSDDEPHFIDTMCLAGPSNRYVLELWESKRNRAFSQIDGHRRVTDLYDRLVPVETSQGAQHAIYPDRDPRILRIVRKIVRGLCYKHDLPNPVKDEDVLAEVLKYDAPPGFLDDKEYDQRVPEIFKCWFEREPGDGLHSWWIIEFFERCRFIAWVSRDDPLYARPPLLT